MKAKKTLLVYVGILVFSLPTCYGQWGKWVERAAAIAIKTASEKAADEANKTVVPPLTFDSLYLRPKYIKVSPNSPLFRYGEIRDSLRNNPSQSMIDTLQNSELIRIYYGLRSEGARSEPTEKTLKLVKKEIQSREFLSEDLTPYVLCPILEDRNAPEQLKSIVRNEIIKNEKIVRERKNDNGYLFSNNFKTPSNNYTPYYPNDNTENLSNNSIGIGMWIFYVLSIGLVLFLIILSFYYIFKHFKSKKSNRTFVVDDTGNANFGDTCSKNHNVGKTSPNDNIFVVDGKGIVHLENKSK